MLVGHAYRKVKLMKAMARSATLAGALLAASQPCLAAASTEGIARTPAGTAAPASGQLRFNLASHQGPVTATASLSMAASQQTASETEEKPRGRGISTTTLLLVGGGLVLAVVILAAVAGAMPTPGPREGAFD